jgi:hypothetical protein
MNVTKSMACKILEAVGLKADAIAKLDEKALADKLKKLDNLVDNDTNIEDKEVNDAAEKVLAAIKGKGKGKDIKVTAEEAAAPEAAPAAAPEAAAKDGKEDKKGKKKAEAPDPKPATPKIPGVRESVTRPYLAGLVIKTFAGSRTKADLLRVGVNEEMVAAVDKAAGKANPAESTFALRNAWHAIRGYNFGDEAHLTAAAESASE